MFESNTISLPEITTLLAALGLVVNASLGLCLMKKSAGIRNLKAQRIPVRRDSMNRGTYF